MHNFKVGDKVTFELDYTLRRPRWNHNISHSKSGVWGFGTAYSIHSNRLHVLRDEDPLLMSEATQWHWPLPGCDRYDPKQWSRPGFIRLARKHDLILYGEVEILCITSK